MSPSLNLLQQSLHDTTTILETPKITNEWPPIENLNSQQLHPIIVHAVHPGLTTSPHSSHWSSPLLSMFGRTPLETSKSIVYLCISDEPQVIDTTGGKVWDGCQIVDIGEWQHISSNPSILSSPSSLLFDSTIESSSSPEPNIQPPHDHHDHHDRSRRHHPHHGRRHDHEYRAQIIQEIWYKSLQVCGGVNHLWDYHHEQESQHRYFYGSDYKDGGKGGNHRRGLIIGLGKKEGGGLSHTIEKRHHTLANLNRSGLIQQYTGKGHYEHRLSRYPKSSGSKLMGLGLGGLGPGKRGN